MLFACGDIDDAELFIAAGHKREIFHDGGGAVDIAVGFKTPDERTIIFLETVQRIVVAAEQEFSVCRDIGAADDFSICFELPEFFPRLEINGVKDPVFVTQVDAFRCDQRRGFETGGEFFGIGIFNRAVFPDRFACLEVKAFHITVEARHIDAIADNRSGGGDAIGRGMLPEQFQFGGQCGFCDSLLKFAIPERSPVSCFSGVIRCWRPRLA